MPHRVRISNGCVPDRGTVHGFVKVLDRKAITLRNVALAAFVILLIAPESLLTASFQMSFAATVALVGHYGGVLVYGEEHLPLPIELPFEDWVSDGTPAAPEGDGTAAEAESGS